MGNQSNGFICVHPCLSVAISSRRIPSVSSVPDLLGEAYCQSRVGRTAPAREPLALVVVRFPPAVTLTARNWSVPTFHRLFQLPAVRNLVGSRLLAMKFTPLGT